MFGKLASASIAPNTPTVIYTAPSEAVVTILLSNGDLYPTGYSIAIYAGTTPLPQDYIKYNAVLGPANNPNNSSMQTEKIALTTGEKIVITTDGQYITARISGVDGIDITTARYTF